jgi:hypothetical protein
MRYYCYNEYDPESPLADETGGYVVTKSEYDIRSDYWPYWYKRMCDKFGQDYVDKNYCFEDCLEDWIVINWAWESKNET